MTTNFKQKNYHHKTTLISSEKIMENPIDHISIEAKHIRLVSNRMSYANSYHIMVRARLKHCTSPYESQQYAMTCKSQKLTKPGDIAIRQSVVVLQMEKVQKKNGMDKGAKKLKLKVNKNRKHKKFDEECKKLRDHREKASMKVLTVQTRENDEEYKKYRNKR